MDEIEVPSYFLCPISLEIMRDPVTMSTGITYDRSSIERWLFSGKNATCPVTKQPLLVHSDDAGDVLITPNHTLRRLIQAWCTLNASYGVERFPTPKPPASKSQISKLLDHAARAPAALPGCLEALRSLAAENEANKRCMESAGVPDFLASVVSDPSPDHLDDDLGGTRRRLRDDAVALLYHLKVSDAGLKSLLLPRRRSGGGDSFIYALVDVLRQGSYEARAYAVLLLKSMLQLADPAELTGMRREFFVEAVQVLRDQISQQATKGALQLLVSLCPWGRNRVKAVEAGAVPVIIQILLEHSERRECELALMGMDQLCGCAEGRAQLLAHGAGLAVVSKKILRVSPAASERAVRVLLAVARFSGCPSVVQEMLEVGVVAKLCLVLQVGGDTKTKEKAAEILKLHGRAWKNSACIPSTLLSSYL